MTDIEVLAFIVGGTLILIGIVGGGVEIWTIRVPAIGKAARSAAMLAGVLFVSVGLSPHSQVSAGGQSKGSAGDDKLEEMLSGSWRITWLFGDVLHEAALRMDGPNETMRVRLTDQKTQETDSVDMTMKLEIGEQEVYLLGSNPVVSGTTNPSPNYAADSFRISVVDDRLQFMLCDTARRCGEVSFERVAT